MHVLDAIKAGDLGQIKHSKTLFKMDKGIQTKLKEYYFYLVKDTTRNLGFYRFLTILIGVPHCGVNVHSCGVTGFNISGPVLLAQDPSLHHAAVLCTNCLPLPTVEVTNKIHRSGCAV